MMAEKSEVEEVIRNFYHLTWADWYKNEAALRPSTLMLYWDILGTACYDKKEDIIHLYLDDGDREAIYNEHQSCRYTGHIGWYPWKTHLVHEMLHEYQYKAISEPSSAGRELFLKQSRNFDGKGHDELFYSAIVEIAPYFKVTPEQLVSEL